MKIIFQLLDTRDGRRSEAGTADREQLAEELYQNMDKLDSTAVLVLMDDVKGDMSFSTAPFFMAKQFAELFRNQGVNKNG